MLQSFTGNDPVHAGQESYNMLAFLTIFVIGRCDSDAGLLEQGLGEGEHGGQRACEKARTVNLSASIHAACDQTGQAASRGMH
ncbi:pyridine nucleotide-disulphide oxidoreductase [Aspergillus luchuensis]|uniref:Pyridine nucleotide-disulphide oxidoreductase n=1 Tax=Aspergillus kawachii TaxID=1069201 RepID=A0A146FL28_ASPKA|nr:pyridine nucleotide-disulphide oxidoreductase [Aspergillus luchuensis]